MLSDDYKFVLERGKYIEDQIVKELWKIIEIYNYPAGNIEHKLFIAHDAYILDRYIESTFLDGIEILTLQISGRALEVMPIGYREKLRSS